MIEATLWQVLASFIGAVLFTGYYRSWAINKDWLDHPNHRSSHYHPIPGGAGVVLLLLYSSAIGLQLTTETLPRLTFWGCPLLMGILGVIDDRVDLPRAMRFVTYALVLMLALALDGVLPSLFFLGWSLESSWVLLVLLVVLLLWWVNLFNFMDGINGIAGFQCIFMLSAAMLLGADNTGLMSELAWVVMGAGLGFLLWNFPKAKVFMGDAGSIFLGAFIGLWAVQSSLSLWVWGILAGVFVIDSSYTLLMRALNGQRWYQAHRSHAYQILARRWRSHTTVVIAVTGVNMLWLLPLAYWATKEVYYAPLIMVLAWLPLMSLCYKLGAGEQSQA